MYLLRETDSDLVLKIFVDDGGKQLKNKQRRKIFVGKEKCV